LTGIAVPEIAFEKLPKKKVRVGEAVSLPSRMITGEVLERKFASPE
jgi:hypothetical protein